MFRKEDKQPTSPGATGEVGSHEPAATAPVAAPRPGTASGGEHSVISAGLRVIGNLESDEDVEVRGTVEGDISSRSLTVSAGARVDGAITAEAVIISGRVSGQVKASSVKISSTGEMTGDITYKTLSIDEGAALDGHCRRDVPEKQVKGKVSNLKPVQSAVAAKAEPEADSAKGGKSVAG